MARISPGSEAAPRGGVALFRLVRFWARRWSSQAADAVAADHALDVAVLEAVDVTTSRRACSVSDVADQLGLDRSRASRMVSTLVDRGLLLRLTDTADARRATLELTSAGQRLLTAARAWQDDVFSQMTSEWARADVEQFARYLDRLAAQQLSTSTDGEEAP